MTPAIEPGGRAIQPAIASASATPPNSSTCGSTSGEGTNKPRTLRKKPQPNTMLCRGGGRLCSTAT